MSPERLYVVIMAGGRGTRMWPLSRPERPKQFLALQGDRTLLQQTWDRVVQLVPAPQIVVVGNEDHADILLEQLPDLEAGNLILEPAGRSTAPCLQLAGIHIGRLAETAVIAAVSSDHIVLNPDVWLAAIGTAAEHAGKAERLVCVGIVPETLETRYGYMLAGSRFQSERADVFEVDRFVEKPDKETLERLHASGHLLRNTGVLVAPLGLLLSEIANHLPEVSEAISPASMGDAKILRDAYERLSPVSIDHGVLQHARRVSVVQADIRRIDVGDVGSLAAILEQDGQANAVRGNCVAMESRGNIVVSDKTTVALVGVQNLAIIVQDDAILVCDRDHTQETKRLQNEINERSHGDHHR